MAEVLAEGDAALYADKRRGRDCAVIAGMPPVEIGAIGDEVVSRDRPIVVNG